MKITTVLATVLMLGATATSVGAAVNNHFVGSDTLKDFTRKIIPTCAGATALIYDGGGSGGGETAMVGGNQEIAPMSRFLQSAVCRADTPSQAQSHVVAFDGIGLPSNTADGCGTTAGLAFSGSITVTDVNGVPVVNCPGCDSGTSTYTFKGVGAADTTGGWKDVLRVVYAGMHHGAANDITQALCAGDVRRSLVNNYASLFQGGCAGGTCTKLNHAYRRDDLSGTTDTFVTLIGLPAATSLTTPTFCNGFESEDKDPIRRPCLPEDDVCSKDGNLGLVLAIFAPPNPTTTDNLYVSAACSATNKSKILPCQKTVDNGGTAHFQCPDRADGDGFNIAGGQITPVTDAGAPCVCDTNPALCKTVFMKPAMDHRVYNLFSRIPNGNIVSNVLPDVNDPFSTKRTYQVTHALYRVRSSAVNGAKAAASLCQNNDDTSNIGCIAGKATCSIGFAGRESVDLSFFGQTGGTAGTRPLQANGLYPTDPNVLGLIYPLSRKLFLASVHGFGHIVGAAEGALASTAAGCYGDVPTVQSAATTFGYVPLPSGTTSEPCQDFDEATTCNNLAQPACTAATVATTCGSMGKCVQTANHANTCATADGTNCACVGDCATNADCAGGRTCFAPKCSAGATVVCGTGTCQSDATPANPCATADGTACTCSAKQCKFAANSASCSP